MSAPNSTTRVLEVADLVYTYPDGTEALRGVTLSVEAGERVAILGGNGAGKTTLALHLNGVIERSAGSIFISGHSIDDADLRHVRSHVGLVFQDADDQLFMPTVAEDVAFGPANLGLSGNKRDQRVADALASVGATELADRAPYHLSGGEKRRAALAGILAMRPELLVLDEPTSGLDPRGQRDLVELLAGIPHAQIVITHNLALALQLCERSIIMSAGRVVADGATAELLADDSLLAQHDLELPYGFDRSLLADLGGIVDT